MNQRLFSYIQWKRGEHSFYRVLNKILRDEDRNKSKKWFSYLKLFDTALEKLSTKKCNLWRGVSGDLSKYIS